MMIFSSIFLFGTFICTIKSKLRVFQANFWTQNEVLEQEKTLSGSKAAFLIPAVICHSLLKRRSWMYF